MTGPYSGHRVAGVRVGTFEATPFGPRALLAIGAGEATNLTLDEAIELASALLEARADWTRAQARTRKTATREVHHA